MPINKLILHDQVAAARELRDAYLISIASISGALAGEGMPEQQREFARRLESDALAIHDKLITLQGRLNAAAFGRG